MKGWRPNEELTGCLQAIGAAKDAARMQNVVSFYEKLPRGSAPEPRPRGFLQWYQAKYMGKNPRAMRMSIQASISKVRNVFANISAALVHLIGGLMLLGYAQNYYFHLREYIWCAYEMR